MYSVQYLSDNGRWCFYCTCKTKAQAIDELFSLRTKLKCSVRVWNDKDACVVRNVFWKGYIQKGLKNENRNYEQW